MINCKKHESCNMYPSSLDCDAQDGIITNGENSALSMGLRGHNFESNMSLAIRVKFNSIPDTYVEYFGNWEGAGGGLGLSENTHYFYFNQFSKSTNKYVPATSNKKAEPNKWYIVVGVLDGTRIKIYIDGKLEASTSFPAGGVLESPLDIIVGGNPEKDGSLYVPVPITTTNALVFNRALTTQEISNYFSKPNEPINYTATDALVNKTF